MSETKTILLAHGSRDPKWKAPFESMITVMKNEFGNERVELAYLEHCSPSIEEVIEESYKNGCRDIRFLPLFMSAGAHLRNDVPKILEEIQASKDDLKLSIQAPVGEHQLFKNALAEIVKENLSVLS